MKREPQELGWDWPEICAVMLWKLKPEGLRITRRDLGALPQDRVLVHERLPDRMNFSFVTVKEAMRIRAPILAATGVKASVSQLSGRFQKLGVVVLWKLRKDQGLTLTPYDRDALPADRILLTMGAKHEVVFRWTTRADAARIRKFERDNEGVEILEVTH